jgi:Homeodomain-like domain
VHSRATVSSALEMARSGASARTIGSELGVPPRTVWDWLQGHVPHWADPEACDRCFGQHDLSKLPAEYVHLLGLYLGDGCLSVHPRGVYRLRIVLDARYPYIISEACASSRLISGAGSALPRSDHCVEVSSYWRQWACHFPQHGPGPKHLRGIVLADWQQALVDRWPEQLVRGLIESDGCRFQNTGRGGWSHPRYSFSNHSADIHGIFRMACDQLGLRWTEAKPYTTYVSRVADVARLDVFVGPKR